MESVMETVVLDVLQRFRFLSMNSEHSKTPNATAIAIATRMIRIHSSPTAGMHQVATSSVSRLETPSEHG